MGSSGGVHLYFRLDIILLKRLSKHTLSMYLLGMKIDPKYVFLHGFLLICLSKICHYDQKHTLFSNFACISIPKQCTRVHCLVLKNNPNYVNFFYEDDIQLQIQVPPQGGLYQGLRQDSKVWVCKVKKTGCINVKSCVQSIGHVGENWVCIWKFRCVKHSLHGWLAKPLDCIYF